LKQYLANFKKGFDTFKTAVELGKIIFNLIEIVIRMENFQNDSTKAILEENNIYCKELTKLIFDSDKGQELLKSLKLKDLRMSDVSIKFTRNKLEVENISGEWESVKQIFDMISKVAGDIDINFKLEKFQNKMYIIIAHQSYKEITDLLITNIKFLEDDTGIISV
jgi:hypothetical protein